MAWRDRPTIINNLPTSVRSYIMYIDESGEGNEKVLKRSFDAKKNNQPYVQRNDLYILNGVVLNGSQSLKLKKKLDRLKTEICDNGMFNYEKKGERPLLLRNYNIGSHKPPFNNMTEKCYEKINRIINSTPYVQISSGINYYMYTQLNKEKENSSPLLMSLGSLLINYAEFLNDKNSDGIIVFEEETKKHDTQKLEYILKRLKFGNKSHDKNFYKHIKAVYFRKKWTQEKENVYVTTAGIELADLTLSPLRRIMNPEYLIIKRKLYKFPNYETKGINIIT